MKGKLLIVVIICLITINVYAFDPLFYARIDYEAEDRPVSVFAVDLDGDGDNDLAIANASSNNVSVLMNSGEGTFHASINYEVGSYPRSVFGEAREGKAKRRSYEAP